MKKTIFCLLVSLLMLPIFVYAAPSAGIKPSSFFYFIDTGLEKLNLIFIFNAEKKANKALAYAEERLLEAKEEAENNKPEGVEEAIEGYEANISLATEKSKELENESETETLLNIISSNTLKHQEVLRSVYDKVPEEAKEAILKAIEISHSRQEEAVRQIGALKKEVAQLQDEIGELQRKLEERNTEQKPSPTPSQKQGSEFTKPTQTPVPSIAVPTSDKSLKELREELERKLKELEKTPTPTSFPQPTSYVPTATPVYTFSPTLTPISYTSTPTPYYTPTPTPTATTSPTSTPTPTPSPTPIPTLTPTPLPTNATLTLKGVSSLDENRARDLIRDNLEIFAILGLNASGNEIAIKSINVTFLNSDPTARLKNVYVFGYKTLVVEPGTTTTFELGSSWDVGAMSGGQLVNRDRALTFSSQEHSYGANNYPITDIYGWQVRINSVKAVLKYNNSANAEIIGLPLIVNPIPRDAEIVLVDDSPQGLQSQNSTRPIAVKTKINTTYPLLDIKSFRVSGIGKSVSGNGTETSEINFQIVQGWTGSIVTQWKTVTSGSSVTITSGNSNEMPTDHRVRYGDNSNLLNIVLDVYDKYYPGTNWQFTIEDIGAVDHKGNPVTISGLPITGHEIHW